MTNKIISILILATLLAVGVASIAKPFIIWNIGWGWWLKVFGDVRDNQKVWIIRTMGVFYILLVSLFFYDLVHRAH